MHLKTTQRQATQQSAFAAASSLMSILCVYGFTLTHNHLHLVFFSLVMYILWRFSVRRENNCLCVCVYVMSVLSKDALVRWGYKTGPTTSECGEADHTMEHCLVCPLLPNPCSSKDLAVSNKNAKDGVKKWENVIQPSRFRETKRKRWMFWRAVHSENSTFMCLNWNKVNHYRYAHGRCFHTV